MLRIFIIFQSGLLPKSIYAVWKLLRIYCVHNEVKTQSTSIMEIPDNRSPSILDTFSGKLSISAENGLFYVNNFIKNIDDDNFFLRCFWKFFHSEWSLILILKGFQESIGTIKLCWISILDVIESYCQLNNQRVRFSKFSILQYYWN